MSANEVYVLLCGHAHAERFAEPFQQRKVWCVQRMYIDSLRYDHYFVVSAVDSHEIVYLQVTGSLLQCMSEPEDVLEYVDGKIMRFIAQRLLKWLERVGGGQSEKITILEVC